jgi:hypothetical protein
VTKKKKKRKEKEKEKEAISKYFFFFNLSIAKIFFSKLHIKEFFTDNRH